MRKMSLWSNESSLNRMAMTISIEFGFDSIIFSRMVAFYVPYCKDCVVVKNTSKGYKMAEYVEWVSINWFRF